MKRIFSILLMAAGILALSVQVQAGTKKWVFTLMTVPDTGVTVYDSGNTTVTTATTDTGVSNMARRHGPIPNELKTDLYTIDISDSGGLFRADIIDLDPSIAATGTSDFSSGTTCGFYVKTAQENTPEAWANTELVPVFTGMAINSGTSVVPCFFETGPANYMRGYFLPSGVTAFGNAQVGITSGFDRAWWVPPQPFIIGNQVYSLNANSGTSTAAADDNSNGIPAGTQYVEMQVIGDSGNSVFYTKDDSSITKANAMTLEEGDYRVLNRKELDNLKMEALGEITVRIDCYTNEP